MNPGPSNARSVVLHPEQWHPPGTKDSAGRYFCLSHWRMGEGGGVCWSNFLGRGWEWYQHRRLCETAPAIKNYPAPDVRRAKAEKSCSGV